MGFFMNVMCEVSPNKPMPEALPNERKVIERKKPSLYYGVIGSFWPKAAGRERQKLARSGRSKLDLGHLIEINLIHFP